MRGSFFFEAVINQVQIKGLKALIVVAVDAGSACCAMKLHRRLLYINRKPP